MRTRINFSIALSSLLALSLFSGCMLTKAPDVSVPARNSPSPAAVGLTELCLTPEPGVCGSVTMSLRQDSEEDHWAYWKAGTDTMVYRPQADFIRSAAWDMRITKYFPLVGSNGGKTALDEGHLQGQAAFAVVPDARSGFIPSERSQVQALAFSEDRYEGLEYGGISLGEEYQNPLVNTIGPGLLRSYSIRDHSVVLSYRVFILKAAAGDSYYAIRFSRYSRTDKTFTFEWRRLL